jgi:hypothetical protein
MWVVARSNRETFARLLVGNGKGILEVTVAIWLGAHHVSSALTRYIDDGFPRGCDKQVRKDKGIHNENKTYAEAALAGAIAFTT